MVPGEHGPLVSNKPSNPMPERRVNCLIRDLTNVKIQHKLNINLGVNATCATLIDEVGKKFSYEVGSFVLTYEQHQEKGMQEINVEMYRDQKLSEVLGPAGQRNMFSINDKNGIPPVKITVETSSSESISDLQVAPSQFAASGIQYVGLVNQAMTCYLNSLLQTLYMTPEFRNALYKWTFDGGSSESYKSIPYQLQKLFLQLQTSEKTAIDTNEVTRSFGWDSSDAWQQHDVQELMRVMFDALEKKWKKTAQADLINELYQGKMTDYVKCLKCNHESTRSDSFLDIPLTIKPFGSNRTYSSVEESLEAFVQPEKLEGNNQYECDKCKKKVDAHKGLKFVKFPYILTLQIKRFDFDYTSMQRIKLNDRLTFPQTLNLNHLVQEGAAGASQPPPKKRPGRSKHSPAGSFDSMMDDDMDMAYNYRNLPRQSTAKGPYEYELFSIMIHSGSAAGGHYYAYIKSFEDGHFYSFNDIQVTRIGQEEIMKAFGGYGGRGSYFSSQRDSAANAYMLVYRQIDPTRNEKFTAKETLSDHLHQVLKDDEMRGELERRQRELDQSMCKIKMFIFHPVQQKLLETKFEVHKDKTLAQATEQAWKLFELEEAIPINDARIVKYDEYNEYIEKSYDEDPSTDIGTILGGVKTTYIFDLMLEVRKPGEAWPEYFPGAVSVKMMHVDLVADNIAPPVAIRCAHVQTVMELKKQIATAVGGNVDPANVKLVLEKYHNDQRPLNDNDKTLKEAEFFKSNKIYAECSGTEDPNLEYNDTKFHKLLDRYQNTIRLIITLPPYPTKAQDYPPVPSEGEQPQSSSPPASQSAGDGTDEEENEMEPKPEELEKYFKAKASVEDSSKERRLTTFVDKRISLRALKKKLEVHVGTIKEYFKVFRVFGSNQEFECTRLADNLHAYGDDTTLAVRLGKALRKNEVRVKIFQLSPWNEDLPSRYLLDDAIIAKGMLVIDAKKSILHDLKKWHSINIPLEKCRLRKKSWKSPGVVFIDSQAFDKDIPLMPSSEFFIEELKGPETKTKIEQMHLFARNWHPSTLVLDKFVEMVLDNPNAEELTKKLCTLSGITQENMEFIKARGTFPCEMSILEIQRQFEWNPAKSTGDPWPVGMDDGTIIFYRDMKEEVKELGDAEKKEIEKTENARLTKYNPKSSAYSSTRKEKALKIYTDESPTATSSISGASYFTPKHADLD